MATFEEIQKLTQNRTLKPVSAAPAVVTAGQTTVQTPQQAAKNLLQAKLAEIRAKSADTGSARSLVSAVASNKQKANAVRDAEVNTSRARKQLEDLLLPQTLGNLDQKEVAKATIREATKDLVDRTKDRGVWGFSSNESGLFGKDDKELNKRVSNEQEGIYNLLKDRDDPLAEAYKRNVRREATEDWAQDIVEAHNSDSALSNFGLGFQGGAEQFIGGLRQLFNWTVVSTS